MSAFTKLQKVGLILLLGSLLIGFGRTVRSIYGSFAALETAENAGIGPVGDSIQNALVFTAIGLVGVITGVLMLIFGRR